MLELEHQSIINRSTSKIDEPLRNKRNAGTTVQIGRKVDMRAIDYYHYYHHHALLQMSIPLHKLAGDDNNDSVFVRKSYEGS